MTATATEFVLTHRVHYSDVGDDFTVPLPRIMAWAQDIAAAHSEQAGFGIAALALQHRVWVLSKFCLRLHRSLYYGDTVVIRSWSIGPHGFNMCRNLLLTDVSGVILAEGSSAWFLTDTQGSRVLRVPPEIDAGYGRGTPAEPLVEDLLHWAPYHAFTPDHIHQLPLHAWDFDAGAHVNNTRYCAFLMEGLEAADLRRSVPYGQDAPVEFRIHFGRPLGRACANVRVELANQPCGVHFRIGATDAGHARGQLLWCRPEALPPGSPPPVPTPKRIP